MRFSTMRPGRVCEAFAFVLLALLGLIPSATRCQAQLITDEPAEGTITGPVQIIEVYRPYQDQSIRFGEHCAQWVSEQLFGWGDHDWSFVYTLDDAFDTSNPQVLSGLNHLNQPFWIEFGIFHRHDIAPGASPAGTTGFAIWEGTMTASLLGSNHTVAVWGFYVEGPQGAKIIPVVSRVDQVSALIDHETAIGVGGLFTPRIYMCALDAAGILQLGQNNINARACSEVCTRSARNIAGVCLAVGLGTCWWTLGTTCLLAAGCEVGLLIDSYRFTLDWGTEVRRSNECLCLESAFRDANPGQDVQNSCAAFNCPGCPGTIGIQFH